MTLRQPDARADNIAARFATALIVGAIRAYQLMVSPLIAPRCRFTPTCSQYAVEAIRRHGPLAGSWLALKRIVRCRPGAAWGYDPVPYTQSAHRSHEPDEL